MTFAYLSDSTRSLPIIFDTGASLSISPCRSDFVDYHVNDGSKSLSGLSGKSTVEGYGTIEWQLRDDDGKTHTLRSFGFHVPSGTVRLFCPMSFINDCGGSFVIHKGGARFDFPGDTGTLSFRTMTTSGNTKLPTTYPFSHSPIGSYNQTLSSTALSNNVLAADNENLSNAQKELLAWHYKLGHINLQHIQRLTKSRSEDPPFLPCRLSGTSSCQLPLCTACEYGKAHRHPDNTTSTSKRKEKDGILKANQLRAGAVVSVDQYVCSQKGRLPTTAGKEKDRDRYTGGIIFVDHASGYMFAVNLVSLGASETVRAKRLFERHMASFGVKVQQYRGDNGVFRSKEFKADLDIHQQTIEFSGVGAHHQNGIAERAIRTISDMARTMMIHANLHWPTQVDCNLWPFAILHAVYLYNRIPKITNDISPIEVLSGSTLDPNWARSTRVWGCPAYVLDPTLQDGKKLPRWKPKSRRGQFLGRSPSHASSVGLIRNLRTGFISTQFHVVYDDFFTTLANNTDDSTPSTWKNLIRFSSEVTSEADDTPPPLHSDWLTDDEQKDRLKQSQILRRRRRSVIPDDFPRPEGVPVPPDDSDPAPPLDDSPLVHDDTATPPSPLRRSSRARKPNPWFYGSDWENYNDSASHFCHEAFLTCLDSDPFEHHGYDYQQHVSIMALFTTEEDVLEDAHPLAFAAKANDGDALGYRAAMNAPDCEQFREAMDVEMTQLLDRDPWDVVDRSMADGHIILDTTWVFKRKRYPDGRVKKHKARLCIRGDQQVEGSDYFQSYAPVVSWTTVRLLLVLAASLGLVTKQVDYTLAFCQAPLKQDEIVFIECPKGYEEEGKVLKLKKSVYGIHQGPYNFFTHLQDGLLERGWKQSTFEPCLFTKDNVVLLCYVDDCLLFSPTASNIDTVVDEMKQLKQKHWKRKFDLEYEEDVAGFLGISVNYKEDGSIELLQTGLIDRILGHLGLFDGTPKSTPAETTTLGKHPDSDPCKEDWSYPSIVGMLFYLANNSRPEIAYAVHQCARFTSCPRRIHEMAVKRIGRYLLGTRDRGLIIHPAGHYNIDMHVDADFAGLWNSEDHSDPVCVRSRTGILITIGDAPVYWQSKLQTEIALSTMEAEYIALSTGMRELIHIKNLFVELAPTFDITIGSTFLSKVFEDNAAALKVANGEFINMTPRSKTLAVKWHWFRSKMKSMQIEIVRTDSADNKADIFTKGLPRVDFERKRKMFVFGLWESSIPPG